MVIKNESEGEKNEKRGGGVREGASCGDSGGDVSLGGEVVQEPYLTIDRKVELLEAADLLLLAARPVLLGRLLEEVARHGPLPRGQHVGGTAMSGCLGSHS